MKIYKKKQDINIILNDKKYKYKIDVEFADIPLGDLLKLREKLSHPKWYIKMFSPKYLYYKFALEDIDEALNQIQIKTEYGHIKNIN